MRPTLEDAALNSLKFPGSLLPDILSPEVKASPEGTLTSLKFDDLMASATFSFISEGISSSARIAAASARFLAASVSVSADFIKPLLAKKLVTMRRLSLIEQPSSPHAVFIIPSKCFA